MIWMFVNRSQLYLFYVILFWLVGPSIFLISLFPLVNLCGIYVSHYSDAIMSAMASQITSVSIVYWTVVRVQIKENIKAPRYWPLWGELIGGRWIRRTKGQKRGKCFRLMTSSSTSECQSLLRQAEAWCRASIWRSHRKVVIKQYRYVFVTAITIKLSTFKTDCRIQRWCILQ